ncbi:hypothetical protein JL720_13870 [Aureococcus anophagefferens]|nr:hypothetical protein JL720_13870 [Aureococcus anophagefferens]
MPPSPEASTTRFEDVDLASTEYLRGSSPMADVESPLSKTEPAGTSHVRGLSSVTGLPLGECATAPSKPKTPKKSKAHVKAAWVGRRTLAAGFFPFKPEENDRPGGARSSLAEFQARRATQVRAAAHARSDLAVVEEQLAAASAALDARCAAEIEEDHACRVAALEEKQAARRKLHAARVARAELRRTQTAAIIAEQRKNAEALAVINDIPLLKPSAELEKNELAELLEVKPFADGALIIQEGEVAAPPELIIVARGPSTCSRRPWPSSRAWTRPSTSARAPHHWRGSSASVSGPVEALILSATNFRMLANSPNMRYMIPMMKREIEIRNFERRSSARQPVEPARARFIRHVKTHASSLQLDIHVAFYQAEKHAMLHTLESIRGTKDAPHAAFDSLKKDSERVIEDTIMASFKGCGAYRRFVEEVFPVVPVTPTGRDSY